MMQFEELHQLIVQWARDRKIIPNSTPETQLLKTMSELGELADATAKRDLPAMKDGLGDVLVTLIMVAELSGLDLVACLDVAYGEIKDRRGTMLPNGLFVKDAQLAPTKSACVYPQCVSSTRTQCEAWASGACEERTGWREAMGEDVAR